MAEDLKPYMTEAEWSLVLELIGSVSPKSILEWGSGGSTVGLVQAFPAADVISIEHGQTWAAKVAEATGMWPLVRKPKSLHEGWEKDAETNPDLMHDYAHAADSLAPFDACLIDGRARSFCIRHAFNILRPGGIAVLHDADRRWYWNFLPSHTQWSEDKRVAWFRM